MTVSLPQQSKLEWTECKSRFRAVTAYGTYWVDTAACSAGYQLISGTNPCCVVFSSPQEAKDYAQTIHDRPSSRDDWFNLSDVEQAPYHAPVDLSDLLRTYETLLAGDNLPERIAVQTVDLRALLNSANLYSQMFSNAADTDTAFTTVVRAAGTALIELTSILEWEKRNHYSQVIMNLAIALDLFGAPAEPAKYDFKNADWFYRDIDPDDNGDTPHESITHHPEFSVHLVHSSFRGASRYVFRAPTLDPSDDDDEVLDFETEEEAIAAAHERKVAIDALSASQTTEASI